MPKLPPIEDILDFINNKDGWEPQEGGGYRRKTSESKKPEEPMVQ